MNSLLDLNQLALFVQVVEAGSFAEAARRLNMPANTVSRQVQQLEDQLGVRLMQRSTRKLTLTEAGLSLHERAAPQVEQLQAAAEQLSSSSRAPSGTVRVATSADFFEIFPAEWVGEFLRAYPDVRLDLVMNDARADLIGEGIDVAFRGSSGGALDDSSLVAREVARFRIGLVASPRYLAERGTPRSLADLAGHDCIKASRPGSRSTWRLPGPHGPGDAEVTGRLSASTAQAQLKAAAAGLGIAMLPSLLTRAGLADGRLVAVLPDHGQTDISIFVVYPSRKLLPRAVSVFIEFAQGKLSALAHAADGPTR